MQCISEASSVLSQTVTYEQLSAPWAKTLSVSALWRAGGKLQNAVTWPCKIGCALSVSVMQGASTVWQGTLSLSVGEQIALSSTWGGKKMETHLNWCEFFEKMLLIQSPLVYVKECGDVHCQTGSQHIFVWWHWYHMQMNHLGATSTKYLIYKVDQASKQEQNCQRTICIILNEDWYQNRTVLDCLILPPLWMPCKQGNESSVQDPHWRSRLLFASITNGVVARGDCVKTHPK